MTVNRKMEFWEGVILALRSSGEEQKLLGWKAIREGARELAKGTSGSDAISWLSRLQDGEVQSICAQNLRSDTRDGTEIAVRLTIEGVDIAAIEAAKFLQGFRSLTESQMGRLCDRGLQNDITDELKFHICRAIKQNRDDKEAVVIPFCCEQFASTGIKKVDMELIDIIKGYGKDATPQLRSFLQSHADSPSNTFGALSYIMILGEECAVECQDEIVVFLSTDFRIVRWRALNALEKIHRPKVGTVSYLRDLKRGTDLAFDRKVEELLKFWMGNREETSNAKRESGGPPLQHNGESVRALEPVSSEEAQRPVTSKDKENEDEDRDK